jgi:hypothetical protein
VKKILIAGKETNIKIDDLIIFNDLKLGFGVNPFFAESRMSSLINENALSNVISDAEHSLIRNRGALGIISKDVNEHTPPQSFTDATENVQKQYEKYGISSFQWNIIITNAALKWQSISQPLKDLMLIEFEEHVAKKICAVFDVPFELFPFSKDSALGNGGSRREAIKELYQNTIIPTSKADAELITNSLCKGTNLTVSFDFSDMWFLQADMKSKAETSKIAIEAFNAALDKGYITIEEWRQNISEYININPNKI